MSEPPALIPQKPPLLTGDSTSQLVQVITRDVGLKNFKCSGNGANDIRRLACLAYNTSLTADTLWTMAREFTHAIDAHREAVPESFRAIVSIAILRARSNVDLGSKS